MQEQCVQANLQPCYALIYTAFGVNMRRLVIVGVIGLILLISACGKNKTENPAPVDTVVENSIGVWSVQDIRSVAQNLVRDMLAENWLSRYQEENLRKPVLMIAGIQNLTDEHIAVENLEREISRELLRSGQVRFTALREDRPIQEVTEEDAEADIEPAAADFAIKGIIQRVGNTSDNVRSKLYQTEITLVEMMSGTAVHRGSYTLQIQVNRIQEN